ncbi:MAG TPA: DNA oxidative demethylase AlkB [Alphaproteobacteria bacterium]|nr:DNA oxidative demethylase AlkB [Alphaproteobacteria bacterium]
MSDLFANQPRDEVLGEGALLLGGFAREDGAGLLAAIAEIAAAAPFRHMATPGGWRMSVAMTNCGDAGWVTDRRGYRYDRLDPDSAKRWPAMPGLFRDLAARAAAATGYGCFAPDACLINRYEPGARMSLHQDINEQDVTQPIVSISLGLPATFLFGGAKRSDRPRRILLSHGDVAVWGGPTRLQFHGVAPLKSGTHSLAGAARFNLTFRKAL